MSLKAFQKRTSKFCDIEKIAPAGSPNKTKLVAGDQQVISIPLKMCVKFMFYNNLYDRKDGGFACGILGIIDTRNIKKIKTSPPQFGQRHLTNVNTKYKFVAHKINIDFIANFQCNFAKVCNNL